jgi:hypothetical protein
MDRGYESNEKAAIFQSCDLSGTEVKRLLILPSTASLLKKLPLSSVIRSQILLMTLTIPQKSADLLSSACQKTVNADCGAYG